MVTAFIQGSVLLPGGLFLTILTGHIHARLSLQQEY